jgi:large subunit ribosomal protein L4
MITKKIVNLIYQNYIKQIKNIRKYTASTKTKAEVKGGGKKPWKQKGTGKSRAGSIRSPLWVKGGIVFGPKIKDISLKLKINKKQKNLSKFLITYLNKNYIYLLENEIDLKYLKGYYLNKITNNIDKILTYNYTKESIFVLLNNLKLNKNKKILIIIKDYDQYFYSIIKKLKNVEVITIFDLTIKKLINYQQIIISKNNYVELILNDYFNYIKK